MKFYNSKNLKKVKFVYTFIGDNDEWFATTEESKWCGSFLMFKEEMKIDSRFEELIDKMTGNYYEILGVEAFFDKDKDVRQIIMGYLTELDENEDESIMKLHNFSKGYNLARRIYEDGEA